MNITVIKEPLVGLSSQDVVCEYARLKLEIHIDENISPHLQRNLVIHSVIENYCRSWTHDKVEQLEELIIDGLDQLESNNAIKAA